MAQTDSGIAAAALGRFRVADWLVEPALGRIQRGQNIVRLEPKVMAVLVHLAGKPGKVISREELEASIWTGTVVGYDAVAGSVQKLRKALEDSPREPRIIETLSKRGYRLVAPVQRADGEDPEAPTPRHAPRTASRPIPMRAILAIALVIAAVGAAAWLGPWRSADPLPGISPSPASIVVLPFTNAGDDPAEEYFADGMTDDLIIELTKIAGLFVISRDSSFHYKEQAVDPRGVGDKLGVRYVVHGSVRRAGNRIRMNVQLTETTSGRQLWAERYDGESGNVFALQDMLTESIMSALAVRLTDAERKRLARRDTDRAAAYENFLRGEALLYKYGKATNREARRFFESAVAEDPKFGRAYAMLAWTHALDFMNGWSDAPEPSLEQGERLATQALALDEALPVANFVRGLVRREKRDYAGALVEAEKAVAIDPSYANGHVLYATLLYYTGRPQEGLDRMRTAVMLNPHHPSSYPFHMGQAYFVLGRYNEAIDVFKKGLAQNPTSERLRVWLAAAYARTGNLDNAKWEMEQVLIANPEFSIARIEKAFPFRDPADLERFLKGLRKAGLSV